MTCKSMFRPLTRLAGATLALTLVAAPEVLAACSDPAGLEVDWHDCDLKQADLSYKILSGANLHAADLSGANLEGVVLIRADLTDANLSGADLTYADLRDAVLNGTNLSGANLTDTELAGANLSGAIWTDGKTCAEGSVDECK